MRVVGECFFWYRLTRVFPDKFHRAVKRLCVVCVTVKKNFFSIAKQMVKERQDIMGLNCLKRVSGSDCRRERD